MKRIVIILFLLSSSMLIFGQSITFDTKSSSTAGVVVNSDLALKKMVRETGNGNFNAYNRQNASVAIFEAGGIINGIVDGQDGVILYIFNGYPVSNTTAAAQLIIVHESSTETNAVNRILTPTGTDFNIGLGKGGVMLIYDGTKQRWRVAAPEPSAGSSTIGWGLIGNGNTNPTSNFIGTTNAQDLVLKTNNEERIRIDNENPSVNLTGLVNNPVFGQITQNYQKIPIISSTRHGGTLANPTSLFGTTPLMILSGQAHDGTSIKTYVSMGFSSDGNFGTNNSVANGGNISFATRKNKNSNLGTRLIISNEGEVLVGGEIGIFGGNRGRINVDGSIAFKKSNAEPRGSGYLDVYAGSSVCKVSGGGTYTLNLIIHGPVPADGQVMHIYVLSSTTLIIEHSPNVSGDGNGIITNTGSDITISGAGGCTLIFDADAGLWRVIGFAN